MQWSWTTTVICTRREEDGAVHKKRPLRAQSLVSGCSDSTWFAVGVSSECEHTNWDKIWFRWFSRLVVRGASFLKSFCSMMSSICKSWKWLSRVGAVHLCSLGRRRIRDFDHLRRARKINHQLCYRSCSFLVGKSCRCSLCEIESFLRM